MKRIPTELALLIASYAAPPAGAGRVLDATCYEGDALRAVGRTWQCETFGCEPTGAATMAAYGTTRVVRDDFLSVRVTHGSMSAAVALLPPPRAGERGDAPDILSKLTDVLLPGGLLALVGDRSLFTRGLCTSLVWHFEPVLAGLAARLLDDQLVLVIAVKRQHQATGTHPSRLERLVASPELTPLPAAARPLVQLPTINDTDDFLFGPQSLDYGAAALAARTHGVWTDPASAPLLLTPPDRSIRPAIPPRRGHVAHIIAGGLFDNLILRRTGTVMLLKGRTPKERIPMPDEAVEDGKTTASTTPQPVRRTRHMERFRTIITALDLTTGELLTLKDL